MAVWGLDVEQVRQLSSQMRQQAETIQQTLATLTVALNGTPWAGPDAERFREEWSSTQAAALRNVVYSLQEASQKAARNADAQEQASAI